MVSRLGWVRPARSQREHRAFRASEMTLCGVKLGASPLWSNRFPNPCPECQVRDPERAEFIEFLIDYLSDAGEMRSSSRSVDPLRLGARFFDGAEPFVRTDLMHGGMDMIQGAEPTEVRWPMDLRIITRVSSDDDDDDGLDVSGWHFQRWRSLDARQARGRIKIALPYPIEWTVASPVDRSVLRFICGRAKPGLWVPIEMAGGVRQSRLGGNEHAEVFSNRMRVGLGIWKLRPEQWRVYFSVDGKPGIELPSDPAGARAAFRLRDIPEGRARRAALRHWVTEHWRINRADPDEEIKVREHLRGASDFTWSGLHCKITPSAVATERIDEAIAQRVEDRAIGTDRRSVSRL